MEILDEIDKLNNMSLDDCYKFAKECSVLISSSNSSDNVLARRIAIHILNKWEFVPIEFRAMWTDIIEAVGFYPYVEKYGKEMILESSSDLIRFGTFSSKYLEGMKLHLEQKKLSELILSGKNVVASAPTSFGKSILIEEIVASKKYKNIVIIQPTLALLDETRKKLSKYSDTYKLILRTTQEYSETSGNLFLLTAERVLEYEKFPKIDFLVIDEFYKLSYTRKDDRIDALNNSFLRLMNAFNPQFYFLGPNIRGISDSFKKRYDAEFFNSDFSMVDCDVIDMKAVGKTKKTKEQTLFELLYSLRGQQTLVYCSSPESTRVLSKKYVEFLAEGVKCIETELPLSIWINENISKRWSLSRTLMYGVAVHNASMEKHIGSTILEYFDDGKIDCIFCTSTIIEGVNTSAKNVIIYDGKKGKGDLDFFDYKNIIGRSGRLMVHLLGNVYTFIESPVEQEYEINFPFYDQNPVSDEILVNIKKTDVTDEKLPKYNELHEIDPVLLEIIKRNGVSIRGQIEVYSHLKSCSLNELKKYGWTALPSYDEVENVLSLAFKFGIFDFEKESVVRSVRHLAMLINIYRTGRVISVINNMYDYALKTSKQDEDEIYDKSVMDAFGVYKKWFQFKVPKIFSVIDSIQNIVCRERCDYKPGSYSFFIKQLENDFLNDHLVILSEMGVPASAIKKIESQIPKDVGEDDIIEYLKGRADLILQLSEYEQHRLRRCIL